MKFSRRNFLRAGCTAAIVTLAPNPVDAWIHGNALSGTNNNRASINVPPVGFMNLAKGAWINFPAGTALDANGYPTAAVGASANPGFDSTYYGQYVWSWTGTASMQFTGLCAIVYAGGTFAGLGGATGLVTANFSIVNKATPRVLFKFGTLVTGVSGGSGSLVTITHTSVNFSSGFSSGSKLKFGVGCSANLSNGPNADGSWTVTNVTSSSCTLNGSTGVVSPTVTGSGGIGAQTEAVQGIGSCTFGYVNSGTFSGLTSLVVCTAANETDVNNGLIYDSVLVNQLLQLKGTPLGVGRSGDFWLRFMDVSGVQGNFESDFARRLTPSSQCWTRSGGGAIYPIPAYQAGVITNTGASGSFTDLYSCTSNPSDSPASGPPIDCEVIQGRPSATNAGGYPGLTNPRSGFGNWPVINGTGPLNISVTAGAASAGQVLTFTFQASYMAGLPGVVGTTYTFTYTTVAGDIGSVSTLNANLTTALVADTTLRSAKMVFLNSGGIHVLYPTPLSGALTIVYTSGPAILNVNTLSASTIGTGDSSFIFNAVLGGFISTLFVQSLPAEAMVELCTRVGANCWYNWPLYTKGSYITSYTNFMASLTTGLAAGTKFGAEVGNEMWNFGQAPWGRAQCYGIALGLFAYPYGSNAGNYSWAGLRTIQYSALSIAAWGAVRAANQHHIFSMTQVDDTSVIGNFDLNWLKGQYLVTTNSNYANYSGLGGVANSTSYNTAGNRPVDVSTAIGMAPYWGSPWMGGDANDGSGNNHLTGTVAQNAAMLQASIDYANGLTATAFTSLTNQFNGTTTKSGGSTGAYTLNPNYTTRFTTQEALAASYDAFRVGSGRAKLGIFHYEGGPQWALGASAITGVNTADSLRINAPSADITALASAMTGLGWTAGQLTSYTISGLGTLTEVATNLLQMCQGWKYDTDLNGAAASTGSYKNLIKANYYQNLFTVSGANREVHGCQYGYAGGQWALLWNTYNAGGAPYLNFDAIAEYNA